MPRDIVRYGIISTAQIALNEHVPAARESSSSEVVAISSRDESKARRAAVELGIPRWYGSYDALITDPDVDAVIVPLPNSMHCEWSVKAAEAGKHVLCEKPLAVTVDEARRMIDAARANDVVLIEAFAHRWNPHLRAARRLIAEGAIGKVTGLSSALTFYAQPEGNIRFSPELAEGSLMDAGCYPVSACRFVLGEEPTRAVGFAYDRGGYGVDTTFAGLLEFPSGAVAHVDSSMDQRWRCELIAIGSEGRIEVPEMFDEEGPIVIMTGDDRRVETTPAPSRFRVQLDALSESILTGKPPEFSAEDGLRNTAVLVALRESAREGVMVNVEQAD